MSEKVLLNLVLLLLGYGVGATVLGGKNTHSDVTVESQAKNNGSGVITLIFIGILALIVFATSNI